MGRYEHLQRRGRSYSDLNIWYFLGGAALLIVGYGLVSAFPDIQRYLKIRSM